MNKKFKFYTNGEKTIKIYDVSTVPDGFYPGRTFKSNPWNRGLTKENNEKIKNYSEKLKVSSSFLLREPWNKGKTKETDEKLAEIGSKISESCKGRIPWNKGVPCREETKKKLSESRENRKSWNKGETKYTNDSLMSSSKKLTGHKCFVSDWNKAKEKEYITKKRNKSFNSSKSEQKLIEELKNVYGDENVIAPYRCDEYPFNCDAYIVTENLFIEYNGTFEHNKRPFDKNNIEHLNEAEEILNKAKSLGDKNRYWNVYKWWTEIDPIKLKTFRENNLNFKIIYPNGLIIDK